MSFLSKVELKKQLRDLGIKVEGNYVTGDLEDDFLDKFGKYRNYSVINVRPYDDGVVMANAKVSFWLYFGHSANKLEVIIFKTPQDEIEDINALDTDQLQKTKIKELDMNLNNQTTIDDIFKWLKPHLDKYASGATPDCTCPSYDLLHYGCKCKNK